MKKNIKSVLFVCNLNSVRSVIAAGLLKNLNQNNLIVESAGVKTGPIDNFAIEVMCELSIDITKHEPQLLENFKDENFDIVITLSPEAQHIAKEMTRDNSWEIEYWPSYDVNNIQGSREQILAGYREIRDQLKELIFNKFNN